jgi:hypothetical protein
MSDHVVTTEDIVGIYTTQAEFYYGSLFLH